jgi:hypothetical protein
MKKQLTIGIGVLLAVIIVFYFIFGSDGKQTETIKVKVQSGEFKIAVTTTGELEAKSSEKIYGPSKLRNVRIWNVKIEDIVPDGTVVDSGDYIASLDKAELTNKMKDQELEIEQLETQFTKTKLDTTLELRNLRDELINLEYAMEERKIELEQSVYEPPTTIRQIKIELEKAQRGYDQAVKNYQLRLQKANATMQEVTGQLTKAQRKYNEMADILSEFTVYAPKAGMVIYKRDWDGKKQGIGSQISAWDNAVATLPNLTEMISKTYVNEIDISKVKVGQHVEIGIDAFPEKKFTGVVTEVANIGEQMKNTNAKVFEVVIEVNEFDSVMRPAMTTKNIILTNVIDSALFVPIECIHTQDSITYIVIGNKRQQVIVGKSNENEIIIKAGLEEDDNIYLLPPEGYADYRLSSLSPDIIKEYSQPKATSAVASDKVVKENKEFDQRKPPGDEERKKENRKKGNRKKTTKK